MTDLLVIGGGAAGLMAAGVACARGLTVTVLEHNPKGPGQKLLITGKGRCNVTSDSDVREFLPYVRHNWRFLYSSLYAFPPSAAMELFESLGVPLKTERGRRVFPRSDRAADVLAALGIAAADHRAGQQGRMLPEQGFQLAGEHAHAVDLEHLLAPAEVADKALLGDLAEVAGVQPAVPERGGGLFRALPVAVHQRRAAQGMNFGAQSRELVGVLEIA